VSSPGAASGHRIEILLRDLAPEVLGVVVRRFRDFAASEDAVQEALIAASEQWLQNGVPNNPRAWLIQVAQRRMTDHIRAEVARRKREDSVASEMPVFAPLLDADPEIDPHDTLVLLFMCCHPALSQASAIALTLRAVGGLTTAEIAKAFLVPVPTMAQRIGRAKETIRTSGIPFGMPDVAERAERLGAVLHVLYLIFNEGYTSSGGSDLVRVDLSNEAIRLMRAVRALLPDDGEVEALLALMLLTDARRAARTGPSGELIPLDEQDRSLWNAAQIAEGAALVKSSLSRGAIGEYQLLAAIASVHDEAASAEDTDWTEIRSLYAILMRVSDNPMVALNHAIATAEVSGPHAGLTLLMALERDERLNGNHRLAAVKAHLLERDGQFAEAVALYRSAAEKTASVPERNYLLQRAERLESDPERSLTSHQFSSSALPDRHAG
jgi:RNA polymerase sigma factor (sigma-70 family)